MKACPFCAEEIQDKAIKCKHCGEFLNDDRQKTGDEDSYFFGKCPDCGVALKGD